MPIHDWSRVNAGLFHDFHQAWITGLRNALNRQLPQGYFALAEQSTGGLIPDVLTLQQRGDRAPSGPADLGVAVEEPPPQTSIICRTELEQYASRANRIAIRHPLGDVIAVIEIVSPGNKDTIRSLRKFVEKSLQLLQTGIHLLVIDLFPPSKRDPGGIHQAIWAELDERPYEPPANKTLTLVSYSAGDAITAYIEPVAVGEELPAMPIFLTSARHLPVPLAATYQDTWNDCPAPLRDAVTGGTG